MPVRRTEIENTESFTRTLGASLKRLIEDADNLFTTNPKLARAAFGLIMIGGGLKPRPQGQVVMTS